MRIENVDRDRTLLVGETTEALETEGDPIGRVQAYTFGYERDLPVKLSRVKVGVGVQATAYGLTEQLKPVYGNHPAGFSVFLHIRPSSNIGEHMKIRVNEQGDVVSGEPQGGNPLLYNGIRAAMDRWKFYPAVKDGEPRCVDTEIPITINFK